MTAFSTMSYRLAGVPLDSENCLVVTGSSLLPGITRRRTVTTMPGINGTLDLGVLPVYDERTITLKVDAFHPKVYEESSRIMRLCAMPELTMTRVRNGVEQHTKVELVSLVVDDDTSDPNGLVSFTAQFAMIEVWWHSAEYYDQKLQIGTTSPVWTPQSTDGSLSDAPLTDMVFRVPGHATRVIITDHVTHSGIAWTGQAQEASLFIDPLRMRAWRSENNEAWTLSGTDVSNGLDYPSQGLLQCWPDAQDIYRMGVAADGVSGWVFAHVRKTWW
ncbi:hypothetical protein [Bifidobacterium sp. SO1]|uniref:hypothetical protein n=1 Tax=Bifidobacterium sp. SO1 TaxID=2809029 RepID=UPI001BDBED94|nr:hypothetical protein [Bifidobacterium sp. SO1]MBT1161203.1 hypothetical protein [Bifidobacterium sp. SO1]